MLGHLLAELRLPAGQALDLPFQPLQLLARDPLPATPARAGRRAAAAAAAAAVAGKEISRSRAPGPGTLHAAGQKGQLLSPSRAIT